jgi:hypothetical protein
MVQAAISTMKCGDPRISGSGSNPGDEMHSGNQNQTNGTRSPRAIKSSVRPVLPYAESAELSDTGFETRSSRTSLGQSFMQIDITTRRIPVLTVICALLLMVGLIAWGAKYKMSLYDPPGSVSASIPHAKLLSQKERPVNSAQVQLLRPPSPQPGSIDLLPSLIITGVLLGLNVLISFRECAVANKISQRQLFAEFSFFSFRPPPTLLLS